MIAWIELLAALLSTAFAQTCYKFYFMRMDRRFLGLAVLLFVMTPVFSYLALHQLSIGMVYMSTALTQGIVVMLSRVILKEHISLQQWAGICLIIVGVLLFAASYIGNF